MRNVIAVLLVLLAMPAVGQEWVQVGESDRYDYYIDQGSIRVNGNLRRAWLLWYYKERQRGGFYSSRGLDEFDCAEERSRSLQGDFYSEPMLKGELLHRFTEPRPWEFVAPGTNGKAILDFVCAWRPTNAPGQGGPARR